jgi:hypothetical protein
MRHFPLTKSLLAGLVFIVLALTFGISAAGLNIGTAARMGPGYFPLLTAAAMGALGVFVIAQGLRGGDAAPEFAGLRGIVLVAGAVLAFAASVESLGIVIAVAVTAFLMSLAEREFALLPALAAAVVLSFFSWLVFVVALGMPWPALGYLLR